MAENGECVLVSLCFSGSDSAAMRLGGFEGRVSFVNRLFCDMWTICFPAFLDQGQTSINIETGVEVVIIVDDPSAK